ncbi:MAG: hypothetical protein E7450_03880 [Ruminococcaceae bacterium]|nr:hypothetical protein [Oscillospiraceae bacterium]
MSGDKKKDLNWEKIFVWVMCALLLMACIVLFINPGWGFLALVVVCVLPLVGFAVANLGVHVWKLIVKRFKIRPKEHKTDKTEELREIDVLANEMFDGDMTKTVRYIMKELPPERVEQYTKEMNSTEAAYALNVLYDTAVEEHGEGHVKRTISLNWLLEQLNMTQEELETTKKNPYGVKVGKALLTVLAAVVVVGVALGLNARFFENETIKSLAAAGGSIVVTMKAMGLAGEIMLYIQFARAKRMLKKLNEAPKDA